jgi:L-amino acid N-acyltransferase YncA
MTSDGVRLRPLVAGDWPAVRRIYGEGIATGNATFETEPPDWSAWNAAHLAEARFVAERGASVVGWAALSPVSSRCVYRGVAEVSVYVAEAARGAGVGRILLRALIEASESAGIWTLQAGIFPENEASAGLHRALGFRLVGVHERLGVMHGRWRDVALYERRSATVGR